MPFSVFFRVIWARITVADIFLQNLQDDGYTIVIMSNQGGIKAALEGVMAVKLTNRLNNAMTDADHGLDVPHFHALFATAMEGKPGSEYRKVCEQGSDY